jgi:lantibiotic biosynthesis protein
MSKTQRQSDFVPSGFVALRTPLLPFGELLAWSEGLQSPAMLNDLADLEEALVSDRIRLRGRLRATVARSEIREALFVASPDLDESLEHWMRNPESDRGQRIERALVRYFLRMAGRPTPFGLFAGCSVATIGSETRLLIGKREQYQRHTRLHMDYLYALIDALERHPAMRNALVYYPNSSLYRAAGRVRYVETRLDGEIRSHFLVAVEETEYLNSTLAKAREGATKNALATALVAADPEVSLEEAEEYIEELIDSQLLVSELSPVVTGLEPIHTLIDQLRNRGGAVNVAERLDEARRSLEEIDSRGLGVESNYYRAVAGLLESLPAKVELPRLFQVDMIKPVREASIGKEVLAEITKAVEILHRLSGRPLNTELDRFRDSFINRYGDGREVPLVEVLDEEVGIGFNPSTGPQAEASALLKELVFPPASEETATWSSHYSFLLAKLEGALLRGEQEIALEEKDLERLESKERLPLPDAFAVTATLSAASEEAIARGDFHLILNTVHGPSGAQLLGRFCHADRALREHVEDLLRAEEAFEPEAIFAEIVHLPEGRVGNILLRPLLREYEIPYLGRSGAKQQIPVDDLMVTVLGSRVVLRSRRLGREVIPRLTSAHNYTQRSLGLYRFLCLLQSQGVTGGLGWSWGPFENAPFLPRVLAGRIVLSRAQWQISKEELQSLGKARGAELFLTVQKWRSERRLSHFVLLADEDNGLPIDLDNILSVETLINLIKNRESAVLVEMIPGPQELCARGPEGRFTHELIMPFVRTRQANTQKQVGKTSGQIRRSFPPGSEWLFMKLYTGTSTADRVLCDVVRPLVDKAIGSGASDQWFFIRYGDPDWHLRLRFHGDPRRLHSEVMPALHEEMSPLLDDGRLWRIQFDTYDREIERYGGPVGILLAEKIFHADSEAAISIVELLSGDEGAEARWQLTLCGIDMLLSDLGLDLQGKKSLMEQIREVFGREFRADTTDLKHQLGKKYMKERRKLEALINPDSDKQSPFIEGLAIFRNRSERLAPLVGELKACERAGRLSVPVTGSASSYIHMHANRLLRSVQRVQELVLYDLLLRLYESQLARVRNRK